MTTNVTPASPNTANVSAERTAPACSEKWARSRLVWPDAAAKATPPVNVAMKTLPPSPRPTPYASAAAANMTSCRHGFSAPSVPDHPANDQPADDPADDPGDDAQADLLRREPEEVQDRAVGDLGPRELEGQQVERHRDAVVQAALDVEALAHPRRHRRVGDDALAERGVGRREDDRDECGFDEQHAREDQSRDRDSGGDGERQPDSEQPHGESELSAELLEVDARRIGEQRDRERHLGELLDRLGLDLVRRPSRAPAGRERCRRR